MKKFLLPALAATLLLAATAVAAPLDAFKGMKGTLDIAGGTAHIPVMKEAAKRIMTANPDIRITVAGGGSGVGVQQVGEGLVQIGNTGRPLNSAEPTPPSPCTPAKTAAAPARCSWNAR